MYTLSNDTHDDDLLRCIYLFHHISITEKKNNETCCNYHNKNLGLQIICSVELLKG
jgi:hypothetical protein